MFKITMKLDRLNLKYTCQLRWRKLHGGVYISVYIYHMYTMFLLSVLIFMFLVHSELALQIKAFHDCDIGWWNPFQHISDFLYYKAKKTKPHSIHFNLTISTALFWANFLNLTMKNITKISKYFFIETFFILFDIVPLCKCDCFKMSVLVVIHKNITAL